MSIPDGTTPFTQTDFSVPYAIRVSEGFADQAIWSLVIPFNQLDWSKPFFPKFAKDPISQNININLRKNAIPFGPYDYNKSRWTPPAKEQPSWSLNLNLYKNAIPFGPYDYNKSAFPKYPKEPVTQALNVNLFTNRIPVLNVDFSKPFSPRSVDAVDVPYNLNLYSSGPVSLPFNQTDWPVTHRLNGLPGLSDQAIWTLISPFSQTDWSKPYRPLASVPRIEGVNIALTAPIVGSPFTQTDWPHVRGPRYFRPAQIDGAIIDVTQPFNQTDWSKPYLPLSSVSSQFPRNPNLFTNPIPFGQIDWSKATAFKSSRDAPQPLNLNLYGAVVVSVPFNQVDWSRPYRWPASAAPQLPFNPNLFTNPFPFAQIDFAKPQQAQITQPAPSYNLALYTVTITQPFNQADWAVATRLRANVTDPVGRNPNLFSEVPFFQTDWAKPQQIKPTASQAAAYNAALYTVTITALPFNQTDWPRPQRITASPLQAPAYNISIYPAPPPVAAGKRRQTLFMSNLGRMMNS